MMKLAIVTMTILDDHDDSPMATVSQVIGIPPGFTEVHFQGTVGVTGDASEKVQVLDLGIYTDDRTDYYEGNKQP